MKDQHNDRPNVVLIITDDQGYGDLSCHGNPSLKTHAMDRIHDESIRFTDFHVSAVCTPTRSQILTGCDAARNGAFSWAYGRETIRLDFPTMAEIFGANDYRTGHFGKWHLGDNYPFRPQDRGFEETIHHRGASIVQSPDFWNNDYFDDYFWHGDTLEQFPGYCTDVWFDEAMKWIGNKADEERPFFLYLPTNCPHGPLYVPDHYRTPYRHLGHNLASFFGMITNIDENLARFDAFLECAGLKENTIFIFMTDNGGTVGVDHFNSGMRGRKGEPYEGGHRVPCFIRWPSGDLKPPGDIDEPAQSQDLLPTLVDLCNLADVETHRWDGISLVPLLRGEAKEGPDRIMVMQMATRPPTLEYLKNSCIMWKKWRLVSGSELYDVGKDPGQLNDLRAKHPEVVKRLQSWYGRWWDGIQETLQHTPRFPVGRGRYVSDQRLCMFDWDDYDGTGNCTQQSTVRAGAKINGPWQLDVIDDGVYEIELRRWPFEANAKITKGVPEYSAVDDTYAEGIALPIKSGAIEIGEVRREKSISAEDYSLVFDVTLESGPATLLTSFRDSAGNELCGAYYTYVRFKK